jgi:hypothetical protein
VGWTAQVVRHPPKMAPDEVMRRWVSEWAKESGLRSRSGRALGSAEVGGSTSAMGVVERTFSWLGHNRRMSKDYERLAETSEAFVYVAMTRLMVRCLVANEAFQTVSVRNSRKLAGRVLVPGRAR